MKELNNVIKIHGKIRNIQLSSKFLKECLYKRVAQQFITSRIIKSQARPSSTIERVFLNDEIGKNQAKLKPLFRKLRQLLPKVHLFLSFFDWIRFCKYLADIDCKKRNQIEAKNFQNLQWLLKQRFGSVASKYRNNICNLSSRKLCDTENFVLSYGLEFCLPPSNVKREQIFAEFEVLMGQLFHYSSKSKEDFSALKARLNDLAHSFCGSPIDLTDFTMHRDCFATIRSLVTIMT